MPSISATQNFDELLWRGFNRADTPIAHAKRTKFQPPATYLPHRVRIYYSILSTTLSEKEAYLKSRIDFRPSISYLAQISNKIATTDWPVWVHHIFLVNIRIH